MHICEIIKTTKKKRVNFQTVYYISKYAQISTVRCRNVLEIYKGNGKVIPLQARCGPEGG